MAKYRVKAVGVGMPAWIHLNRFGKIVHEAFGGDYPPFLVGSALKTKRWRDVDVRHIISDEEWEKYGFGDAAIPNARWAAFSMAFSLLGSDMTGLPIDFQIQQRTYANDHYKGARSVLGLIYTSEKRGK